MPPINLSGAADLHCHFGPDAHRERSVDALEAARDAADAGHAAVVLKSHDYPTAALAAIVDTVVDDVRVFGGICCDREVGGVNPAAVETALRLGAKIVWLPTLTSRQDQLNGVGAQLGIPGPGLSVVDDDGALLPETLDVLDLVEESGAILATGHVTWEEHRAVTKEFGTRGRLLVTHALEELAGPNLSVEQCVELADLGATVELCALTCLGAFATRPPQVMAAAARTIGVGRCTLATDFGQKANVPPAEGFQSYADALAAEGLTEGELRTMACTNPCALLGLDS
ncbi:MAG TPA: DUF6282 family protein [Acidimicrobiia bacterium]|nr:DUF6282 family protein [Acidimicrobiia bacterium]